MLRFLAKLLASERGEHRHNETKPGSATSEILRKGPNRHTATGTARGAATPQEPTFTLEPKSRTPNPGAEDEFDPYNTGAFDRGASWDRIGKRNL